MRNVFYPQSYYRSCQVMVTLVVLLGSSLLLSQCTTAIQQKWSWHYIVPDNYRGFLAIRYECPGGVPFPRSNNSITVKFAVDGTFCTSEKMFSTKGDLPIAENYSGAPIPYVIEPRQHRGYAMCCGSSRSIGGHTVENPGSELSLDILWVGMLEPRPIDTPEIPDDIRPFLRSRFGLREIP